MRRKIRKNVGVIGLGIIGSRAAAGLRAAGFHVFVWNRTPRPAPNFLGSSGEVAGCCDIIQLFVADAVALMEVLGAIADKLTAAHTIICSATVGPEATMEAARFVAERGAKFLDAPFTGSKIAAERRELVYYVGGDDTTFLPVRTVLEATSKTIVRTGGIGDAALVKVVTNQISAVSIQVLAEALAIIRKAGVPQEVFAAALEHNAARSGAMELKLPKMMNGDYDPHFSLKHMFKDVQLSIHVANSLNLETPTAAVTAGVMFGAIKRGWGDLDFASVYRLYEDLRESQALSDRDAEEASPYEEIAAQSDAERFPEETPQDPGGEGESKSGDDGENANGRPAETTTVGNPASAPLIASDGNVGAFVPAEKFESSPARPEAAEPPTAKPALVPPPAPKRRGIFRLLRDFDSAPEDSAPVPTAEPKPDAAAAVDDKPADHREGANGSDAAPSAESRSEEARPSTPSHTP